MFRFVLATFPLATGLACLALFASACTRTPSSDTRAPQSAILHLEDELDGARVTSEDTSGTGGKERSWSFDEPQPEWRGISATLDKDEDATHLTLTGEAGFRLGGMAVDVEESPLDHWSGLVVRVRSHGRLAGIAATCNVDAEGAIPDLFAFFTGDGASPAFNDGSVQSYSLPFARREGETLKSIGVFAGAPGPASFDVLSVTLVPRGAAFGEDVGVASVDREGVTRRTLYAHAPVSIAWDVRVPADGRVDVGLTCLPSESITYRIAVAPGEAGGPGQDPAATLEETIDDAQAWHQHTLDLSPWAGKQVELRFEASSDRAGAVALFGSPIVSGAPPEKRRKRPNVIFYVIDGGGADFMSLYGYNRRTTPFLERLAEEAVVFEHAHSNSTWTQPSTASFMTSLHHSVLGGLRRGLHSTPIPSGATTMAEHMRGGGYQTASLTTNPNAARVIGLERGVDLMRDIDDGHHSTSSEELHERFWTWREEYPGQPYWVHFQTTDVHEPNEPVPPYSGLYVTSEQAQQLDEWGGLLFQKAGHLFGQTAVSDFYDRAIEAAEIDRRAYYNVRRGLYDETMAFQDSELKQLVTRLKAAGEWEDTLLVIGSDHGHPAGTFARFGRGLLEPKPDGWEGALFDAFATHVPLLFVWSGTIPGGRRIEQPVSMIDVLPTLLELLDLPPPEIMQGRSLAPLLSGGELEPRPVILDEFRVDEATGEMVGNIDMIDGRWGASLQVGRGSEKAAAGHGRFSVPAGGRWGAVHPFYPDVPQLLLYDLWRDPLATKAVNEDHPDLVAKYREELLTHWKLHQALATRFTEIGDQALTPEILEQLRTLGYVR